MASTDRSILEHMLTYIEQIYRRFQKHDLKMPLSHK